MEIPGQPGLDDLVHRETPRYVLREHQPIELATLRDQFAMAALTGILGANFPENTQPVIWMDPSYNAKLAFQYADAMMAEREKSN